MPKWLDKSWARLCENDKKNKGPIMRLILLPNFHDLYRSRYRDKNTSIEFEKGPWQMLSLRAFTTVAGEQQRTMIL